MQKRLFPLAGLAAALLLSAPAEAQAQAARPQHIPERIRFAPGATSKTIRLSLSPRRPRASYVVKARAGQQMSVKVTPRTGSGALVPGIDVTSPLGSSSAAERPKAQRIDIASTEAGDYSIEVAANQMASRSRSGTVLLKVWVR